MKDIHVSDVGTDCCTIDDRVLDTLDRPIERHLFLESEIPRIPIDVRE